MAIGEELGSSPWHTVTQEQVNDFARATGDFTWLHVDPVLAGQGPHAGTIAHGFFTLSMVWVLGEQIFTVSGVDLAMNYGVENARFTSVVPVGSRIRARATLKSVSTTPSGQHRVVVGFVIEVDGQHKPACVVDAIMVYFKS
jgi:acyl dehydratase